MTDQEIRNAIDTPAVAYELGYLVGVVSNLAGVQRCQINEWIQPGDLDTFYVTLASELCEGSELHDRRLRYIAGKLSDELNPEFFLEPVIRPEEFTDPLVRKNVAEQLAVDVSEAGILDYEDWLVEEDEIARDAAIQSKIDQARGK